MKRIMIYPNEHSDSNYYINNLTNILKDQYTILGMCKEKDKGIKKLLNGDVYHFNWYESIDSTSYVGTLKNYIKRTILVNILKINRKKIVWTVHNNQPHNLKYERLNHKIMKFMARKSDRIHILCKDTINNNEYLQKYKNKIVYIPHGDYIGNYPKSNITIYERYNIPENKRIMLFIGQIRKYKNIEILIKAFKDSKLEDKEFILLICGNCSDKEYKEELKKISNENVLFDFNFIKNEEMEAYLRNSQIIVAPYDKKSSLNSGTLWMAMSYSRTMMLPLIGCVKDINNYDEYLYVYDYSNENDHDYNLLECMKKIKSDIEKNENILVEKGNKANEYIVKNQAWKNKQKNWIDLYKF